jgi:hypothetical protein
MKVGENRRFSAGRQKYRGDGQYRGFKDGFHACSICLWCIHKHQSTVNLAKT